MPLPRSAAGDRWRSFLWNTIIASADVVTPDWVTKVGATESLV